LGFFFLKKNLGYLNPVLLNNLCTDAITKKLTEKKTDSSSRSLLSAIERAERLQNQQTKSNVNKPEALGQHKPPLYFTALNCDTITVNSGSPQKLLAIQYCHLVNNNQKILLSH